LDPTSHRYWAFLSYSHRDERWARWLHKSVETYRGHRRLVGMSNRRGETIPERLFPVFRDRDELAGAADLPASITQALQSSRFLVVLCSPSSAKSTYVDQEIRYFKSIGRQDRILALIIDGEPHAVDRPDLGAEECFPEALKFAIDPEGRVTSRRMEPVAADVRPGKDGKRNALLKIVSGILGVGFDELRQRDQERRMRLLVMAATGGLVGVIVFAVLAVVAYVQRNEARDARARAEQATRLETEARISAEARALAIQAEAQRIKDRSDLALLLGIEAHRRHGALDGYQPVLAALEHEPRLRGFLHGHRRAVSALALSPDGGQMASGDRDGEVWIWDIAGSQLSGRRLYTHPSPVN
jgi:hypothetical protein